VQSASKPLWQQVTALVSLGASGTITGFSFVPSAAADLTSPTSMPIRLMALERSVQAAPVHDATLRSAIVNVANYYLRMAQEKTPAEMEAIIWQHDSLDGADHGPSCAAFASLTLELAAHVVGQQSWVTGGSTYPWPLSDWADVRVDPNPASPDIISVLQDAQAHGRWHPLGDGYDPQPGDWVLFDGHVEVVTKYANGVLDTIGGDSLPNFSVNAHQYQSPLAAQGVAGYVDNGNLSSATPTASAGHGHAGGYHHERGRAGQATRPAQGTPATDADDPSIPGIPAAGAAGSGAPGAPASVAGSAVPGAGAAGGTVAGTAGTSAAVPGMPTASQAGSASSGKAASGRAESAAPGTAATGGAAAPRPSASGRGGSAAPGTPVASAGGSAAPGTPVASAGGSAAPRTRGDRPAAAARPGASHPGSAASAATRTPTKAPAGPDAPSRHRSVAAGRSAPRADGVAAIPGVPAMGSPASSEGPAGTAGAEPPTTGTPASHRPSATRPDAQPPASQHPANRPAASDPHAAQAPASHRRAAEPPTAPRRAAPAATPTTSPTSGRGQAGAADVPGATEAGAATAPASTSADGAAIPGLPTARRTAPPHRHAAAPGATPAPATNTQQAFIDEIAPGAMATQRRYGVPAAVTIAQAIDESGWGQSELAVNDHNLFGIKGTGPAGSDSMPTQEYENGEWVTTLAPFRVYDSFAESIADHGALLADSGYYTQAMAERANPDAFANALTGVYATNPEYGGDLIQIMRQFGLYRYDGAGPSAPPAAKHAPAPDAAAAPPRSASSHAPAARPSPSATAPSGTTSSGTPTSAPAPQPTITPQPAHAPAPAPQPTPTPAATPSTQPTAPDPADPTPAVPGLTPAVPQPKPTAAATGTDPVTLSFSYRHLSAAMSAAKEAAGASAAEAGSWATEAAPTPAAIPVATAADPANTLSATSPATQAGRVPRAMAAATAAGRAHSAAATSLATPTMRAHARAANRAAQRPARPALYHPHLPPAVKDAFVAMAKAPIMAMEFVYRDVASHGGIPWELLAACDWMQCQARPRYSPVHGEKLGAANADGTVYRTKSEALEQCVYDLVELTEEIYGIDIGAQPHLSVPDLANVFAAFRWGGLLKLHNTSAMEFPYSVAGLTAQHLSMRWPNIDESRAPDRPGARFRMPFGAVPLVLSLHFPATV
jgi:flagellum-specific peptidoglycan hydrolase FlgJ